MSLVGLVGLVGLANHLCQEGQMPQSWFGLGFLCSLSGLELPAALGHLTHLEKISPHKNTNHITPLILLSDIHWKLNYKETIWESIHSSLALKLERSLG